jgi:phosphoserine phosphatase RsbU/P
MQMLDIRAESLPSSRDGGLSRDLDLIVEMTGDFAHSRDVEETLRRALVRICDRIGAEAASLFLMDGDTGDLVCRACAGPVDVAGLRLPPGNGIVWRTVVENTPQLVRDASRDPDFTAAIDDDTGFITRSILCAPLSVRDERLGAIELFNKRGNSSFLAADRRLLQALATSAALALTNARLVAAIAEQEALRRELLLAADIQRAMLPKPQGPDAPIHGLNVPARGVSGDFYEIMALADGRIAFAIGDVSGKGMNAALLMAKTASLFRCLAKRVEGPGALLAAIDAELNETGHAGMFVTMVAGTLDPARGRVVLANAGHEPPLVLDSFTAVEDGNSFISVEDGNSFISVEDDNSFISIDDGMPPLGIATDLFADGCPESVIDLAGRTLYLFTDGLTEAKGSDGAMLGREGVERLLTAFAEQPAGERLRRVVRAVDGIGSLRDDLTLLAVEDRR